MKWTNKLQLLLFVAVDTVLSCSLATSASCRFDAEEIKVLFASHDYVKAEARYKILLDTDRSGRAFAGLIVALTRQNRVSEAEKYVRLAKDRFSNNPFLMGAAGFLSYSRAVDVSDSSKRDLYLAVAEDLGQRATKLDPDNFLGFYTLGLAKLALDQPKQAAEDFRKCAVLVETAEVLNKLATSLLKTNPQDGEAETLIERALSLDPEYLPAYVEKAAILLALNRTNSGFLALQHVPSSSRDSQWFIVEGDLFLKKGEHSAALASWNKAMYLDPYRSDAYERIAVYYTAHKKKQLASNALSKGLRMNPNNQTLREHLSRLAE